MLVRVSIVAFLLALAPLSAQTLVTEKEPNNTYASANVLTVSPTVVTGAVAVPNDIDYYRMIVFGYRTIHAKLFPAPLTSQFLYIYNQAGRIVAQSTLTGGSAQEIYYTNTSPFGFYFYAVVRSPLGVSSPDQYSLEISW